MKKEELIQKLSEEMQAKINAEKEIERFKRELERIQNNIKEAEYFIKMQDKVIDKIINDLRGE